MTNFEKELVANLRRKIGDNPTRVVTSNDIGTTLTIEGVTKIVDLSDVNKIADDTGRQIWSDSELLSELLDSLYIIFPEKESLTELDELEKRIVILATRVELTMQLALDSARYIRYQSQNVGVDPVSPSELINLAKALKESLEEILDDYIGRDSERIKNGIIKFSDRYSELSFPTNYAPTPSIPKFTFTYNSDENKVYISAKYQFIDNFNSLFIKRELGLNSTIIFETTVCKEYNIVDSDVEANKVYKYIIYLETLDNPNDFYKEEYIVSTNAA